MGQRIAIPLTGPAYKHRSQPVSAQTCLNWFPEQVSESPYQAVLSQPPGSRHVATNPPGGTMRDRGMHIFKNQLYKVSGSTIYRMSASGVLTEIGTINGSKRCVFISNANEMVIVTGGLVYRYTGTSLILASNPAFELPQAVAYLNNQAIYDGQGSRFVVSNAGNLTIINALNYGAAESSGDDLVRPYTYQQQVYMMGTATIEPWWNPGTGNPPIARVDGGIIQVGLGAIYSVDHNDIGVFFLGSDRSVHVLNGSNSQSISTIPLAQEFAKYSRVDDAIGFCFTFDDQHFYQLYFKTVNKTWCYNVEAKAWFERSSGSNAHIATSYAFCYGRHLIGHNQYILEWDPDLAEDRVKTPGFSYYPEPLPMLRERITATINGVLLGAPGRDIHMGRLELTFEAGRGAASGQGADPEVMMSFSDDNGLTWSNEQRGHIGRMGNFLARAAWDGLGSFQSRVIRFRVSDPVRCTLLAANADVEVGI